MSLTSVLSKVLFYSKLLNHFPLGGIFCILFLIILEQIHSVWIFFYIFSLKNIFYIIFMLYVVVLIHFDEINNFFNAGLIRCFSVQQRALKLLTLEDPHPLRKVETGNNIFALVCVHLLVS